jgi:uncharacterized membrane protein YedE/YeeE
MRDEPSKTARLVQAIFFGLMFGFLLQKGGVGKYHVLEGQLLLQDFTVVKVMMSAVLVGMIGVYLLHKKAGTRLHIVSTKVGANILGGLIFGAGFALSGYCPGTGAVAFGQGDVMSIFCLIGLVIGSYLYAEASEFLKKTVQTWGDKGKITLPSILHAKTGVVVATLSVIFAGNLLALSKVSS